jgi:predicted ribosomally synthesized peptide with nif11-like leader
MSERDLQRFLQAILDDGELQEQLKTEINQRGIDSPGKLAELAVEVGRGRGFELTTEEVRASMDKMSAVDDTALTEDELDIVAGGAAAGKEYSAKPANRQLRRIIRRTR